MQILCKSELCTKAAGNILQTTMTANSYIVLCFHTFISKHTYFKNSLQICTSQGKFTRSDRLNYNDDYHENILLTQIYTNLFKELRHESISVVYIYSYLLQVRFLSILRLPTKNRQIFSYLLKLLHNRDCNGSYDIPRYEIITNNNRKLTS